MHHAGTAGIPQETSCTAFDPGHATNLEYYLAPRKSEHQTSDTDDVNVVITRAVTV